MFYYPSSLLHSLLRIQLLKWTAVKRWLCHPAINWSWKLAKIVIAACEWNKDHNCFSFHSLHLLGTVIDWWDPHFHQHAHTFSPFSLSVVLCRALQQDVGRGGYQIAFTMDGVRDMERREGTKDKRRRGILSSYCATSAERIIYINWRMQWCKYVAVAVGAHVSQRVTLHQPWAITCCSSADPRQFCHQCWS